MATFKGTVHIPYMELGNMIIECLGVGLFGRFCSLRNRWNRHPFLLGPDISFTGFVRASSESLEGEAWCAKKRRGKWASCCELGVSGWFDIYGSASLGTPPPHPMVMGLHSSAPVPPPPPVVWCGWCGWWWVVVVVVVVEEVVYVCIWMYIYVWYECIFLVFVYDYDMIMIWLWYDMYIKVYLYMYMHMYMYMNMYVYMLLRSTT